jgi:CspA family cold shock protein
MSIKSILQRLKNVLCFRSRNAQFVGKIKFFDRKKGFGFIISDQHEYFFHAASTKSGDYKALQDGVMVRFNLIAGKKGPQADNVEIVKG